MPYVKSTPRHHVIRSGDARPADSSIKLGLFKQLLSAFAVQATVVPAMEEPAKSGKDAFDAIRHDCAATTPNLRVAHPDEDVTVPLRHVATRGETFRGKHGKLTVIRVPR